MSTGTKNKNVETQVVELLYEKSPQTTDDLHAAIGFTRHTIHGKCLSLVKKGLVQTDGEHNWWIMEGVTPDTPIPPDRPGAGKQAADSSAGSTGDDEERSLDPRDNFTQLLKRVGVKKDIVPTIVDLFFEGDIDDLHWLNRVLQRSAAGWVNAQQRRMVNDVWSHTRGLPYDEDDFSFVPEPDGRGKKGARGEEAEPPAGQTMDAGVGWKVEKDDDGDWVAIPGGPLPTYREALEAAKQRQVLAAYAKRAPPPAADDGDEDGDGRPPRRGAKQGESLVDKMMLKMVDKMLDGDQGRGSAESETIARLTDRIDGMERERTEERFERLEGLVAQAASRDPWDDFQRITEMREKLGVGAPVVTDQSPAVQLIKDSTDKMDKNVGRMVGLFERIVLRDGDIKLEETRTPEAREEKAGQLLQTVEDRGRSRGLRKNAFGL